MAGDAVDLKLSGAMHFSSARDERLEDSETDSGVYRLVL
jgi:hypothetical protein